MRFSVTILCILHINVLVRIYSTAAVFKGHYFKALFNTSIDGEHYRTHKNTMSQLECATRCPLDPTCSAITFDEATKDCALYSWLNTTLVFGGDTLINDPTPWINIATLWFSVRNSNGVIIDFPGAEKLCEYVGGHLTLSKVMYAGKESGYNLCRCGYVSDEAQRFVLSKVDPGCEPLSTSTGVGFCVGTHQTPFAYCSFG